MIPIDIQVSRFKVKGQAYSLYVGEGGISVLQTSIFHKGLLNLFERCQSENYTNSLRYATT